MCFLNIPLAERKLGWQGLRLMPSSPAWFQLFSKFFFLVGSIQAIQYKLGWTRSTSHKPVTRSSAAGTRELTHACIHSDKWIKIAKRGKRRTDLVRWRRSCWWCAGWPMLPPLFSFSSVPSLVFLLSVFFLLLYGFLPLCLSPILSVSLCVCLSL